MNFLYVLSSHLRLKCLGHQPALKVIFYFCTNRRRKSLFFISLSDQMQAQYSHTVVYTSMYMWGNTRALVLHMEYLINIPYVAF